MAKIIGLGAWFPSNVRVNSDWDEETVKTFSDRTKRDLVDITSHGLYTDIDQFSLDNMEREKNDPFIGSLERRVMDPDMPAYEAEAYAGAQAISQAGIDLGDIGAVFSFSSANDRVNMASAPMVAEKLGIKSSLACEVNGACSSNIIQISLATALIAAGQVRYVLLVQSNIMSRGVPMGHPASPGIGDCATAILIGADWDKGHSILNTYSRTHGEYWDAVVWKRRADESQNWYEPGGGFYLGSNDPAKTRELIQITGKAGCDTVKEALAEINLTVNDLNFLATMQPRQWIPEAIGRLLGLKSHQTIETYRKYAHLGGCGPVVNLLEAANNGLLKDGDVIALYAQGAGFTRTACIIRW